jgi:hypothetical protein
METAFGILLFVLVYGGVAYVIYNELTGKWLGVRWLQARRERDRRTLRPSSRPTTGTSSTASTRLSAPSR